MTSTGNNQSCVKPETRLGEKRKATSGPSNNWKPRKVCAVRTMPKHCRQFTTNHVTSEGKMQRNSAITMEKQKKIRLQSRAMEHSSEEVNKPWDEQPPKLKLRTLLNRRIFMATREFPKAFEQHDKLDYGLEPTEYDYIPLPSDSLESDSSDNEESSDQKSISFDGETSSDSWIRNCKRRVVPDLRCSQPGHETSRRADPGEVLGDPDNHFLPSWGYSSEDEPVEYFTGSYNEDYLRKAHSSEEYLDSLENDPEKSFDSVESSAASDERESVTHKSTDFVDQENSMDNDKHYALEPTEYDYIPLPSDSLESNSSDNEESLDQKSASFDGERSSDSWIRNCKTRALPDLRCSQPGDETSTRADQGEVLGDPDDHFLPSWGYSSEDEPVEYFNGSYNEDYLRKANSSEECLDSFENHPEKSVGSVESCVARDEEELVVSESTDLVDQENSLANDGSEVISQPNFGNQPYNGIKESIYTAARSFAAEDGPMEENNSEKSESSLEPERTSTVERTDNFEAVDACDNQGVTIEYEDSFSVVGADVRDQDATLRHKSSFSIGSIGRLVTSDPNYDIMIKHNITVTIKPRSNFGNPGGADDQ